MTEIQHLIDFLNYHTKLYEEGHPIISDTEWDNAYFRLQALEELYDIHLPDSPTQGIKANNVSTLNRVEHNHPMLSLDKTRNWTQFRNYFADEAAVTMLKLDGLTCSLWYKYGMLYRAETRGDGKAGEDITQNILTLPSVPYLIDCVNDLVIDGEIVCKLSDFTRFKDEYANPRNFAAGSIRLLDPQECAKRKLTFCAWNVVSGLGSNSFTENLNTLQSYGFTVVPHEQGVVNMKPEDYDYPTDGLVCRFDNIEFGTSLGATSHHTKAAYAFKFEEDKATALLTGIDWSMSKNGVLTPVAMISPINLNDTTISRVNLHNLSVMEKLNGGLCCVGDELIIHKAHEIIPEVIEWRNKGGVALEYPTICPICGAPVATEFTEINKTKYLLCTNDKCDGKLINQIDHYASRAGMDIRGLSVATIEKLADEGWLNSISDIYNLHNHREEWIKLRGFGVKSVDSILKSIEKSKLCALPRFIVAMNIPLIGTKVAEDLAQYIKDYDDFRCKVNEGYAWNTHCKNFGEAKEVAINNFDYSEFDEIAKLLNIVNTIPPVVINPFLSEDDIYIKPLFIGGKQVSFGKYEQTAAGKSFVISGRVHQFKNRQELKSFIEGLGGAVHHRPAGTTDYLILNDKNSQSQKAIVARDNGTAIITEEEFLQLFYEKERKA